MLETLSSLCAGLESAKTQRAQALSALQLKKDRIEQFAKMTVSTGGGGRGEVMVAFRGGASLAGACLLWPTGEG